MQDTGTDGNRGDVVWVLMHRRQEATESLTQNPEGILHDTPGTSSCKCVLVRSATDGRMVSSSRSVKRKRHPLRSDRALAGHH